jgi:hypothetical protein
MPGMNSGLNISDPTVVAAFKAALLHQGRIALLIFALLGLAWVTARAWLPAAARDGTAAGTAGTPAAAPAEPAWRRLLRIGFGLLWIFDGILQAQPKMAIGLPSQVIEPSAASSPAWVQHAVNWAGTTWSYHPVQAGASAVWIQVGIGSWMLAASRGAWSRLAGIVSVGWGLVVWAFGESFGGIFAPGLTWLFGAPGAVLIYCVAGALIALPERTWRTARLGRLTLAGMGLFLAGMAVLQAWPGRGFWQGRPGHGPGTLTGMIQSMAQTPQPRFLSALVSGFGSVNAAHGFAVNLFVVAVLAVTGGVFLGGRPRLIRPAVIAFTAVCLADWVLIEDIGFFGGLGTDPNSMIPMALLAIAGYLALARVPVPAAEPAGARASAPASAGAATAGWRDRARPGSLRRALAGASIRSVASAGAIGLIILGAAPMAAAQASPVAGTILARAIDGSSARVSHPAPRCPVSQDMPFTAAGHWPRAEFGVPDLRRNRRGGPLR